MVKIDGARIRAIRELKGLTQLYVATAVEVTTDTVSRWENKRYPTIKKDNALRLAAALEVDLQEILEREEDLPPPEQPVPATATDVAEAPIPTESRESQTVVQGAAKRHFTFRLWILTTGALLVLATAAALVLVLTRDREQKSDPTITIRRTAPPHFIAGQPFPVFLSIDAPGDRAVSVILRESIPPGMQLGTTLPPISGHDKKDNSIKWLKKVTGATTFAYTLHSDSAYQGEVRLDGTLKVTGSSGSDLTIVGDSRLTAGVFHWADANRDNRISDEEILAVYDLIGTDHTIDVDMGLIEDIWLGDGYVWQQAEQRLTVVE
ncbi:helix-turn-helix transcriptional regulator [Desulfofustis limnaeus]|jgi:transcriptional regulator with XRE-family HTH domain|uniref:Transcriptional regulator n=1 Tax=Desulfofustis limnaeus TaxID=2740163 RepID=A0ABN6M220_9BACT|nr:helix-turn-helix transcriptional regulator [Desulfofustis limnaeus]MDX9894691.1 helix-turn-helix transcriptional regulator [Desulfofustis sp.]BDD86943.1 transcriptional regulator [Desulfofustis limnaeus]